MKVIFHPRFYEVYTSDPAAAPGRMEPMVKALDSEKNWGPGLALTHSPLG
jgi:hypothetical protein